MRGIYISALLASTGCWVPADTGSPADPPEDFSACSSADGRELSLNSAAVEADTLSVELSYAGGCEPHEFTLCWPDQAFMESEPVQAQLEVLHSGPFDMCEALITETVDFDLAPLRTAWEEAYGAGEGTILLHIEGLDATYSF